MSTGEMIFAGIAAFFFILVPLAELERRIGMVCRRRRQVREHETAELMKDAPDMTKVSPEVRLEMMRTYLEAAKQTLVKKEVDTMLANLKRPAWKTWAILPIILFNGLMLAGAVAAFSPFGVVVSAVALLAINGIAYFECGADQVEDYVRHSYKTWMPNTPFDVGGQPWSDESSVRQISTQAQAD